VLIDEVNGTIGEAEECSTRMITSGIVVVISLVQPEVGGEHGGGSAPRPTVGALPELIELIVELHHLTDHEDI